MRGARRGCEGQRLPLARARPAPSPASEPRRVHGPGVLTSARGPRLGVAARDPPSRAAARRALPPSRAAARLLKRRVNDSPSFLMCNHAVLHSDRNGTRVLTSEKVRLLSGECDGKSAAALVEIQMRGALPRHIGEPRESGALTVYFGSGDSPVFALKHFDKLEDFFLTVSLFFRF